MESLKGHLLVARHYLLDPNFFHSVVLMLEHNEEGAFGVVINRNTETTIGGISDQAFEEPVDWEKPIGLGGPVTGPLLALHQRADLADQQVMPELYSTTDADKLMTLVREKVEPTRFVANYSGWGPGQLEGELAEASWLVLPASIDHIFCEDETELWKEVARQINRQNLTSMLELPDPPEDPRMN